MGFENRPAVSFCTLIGVRIMSLFRWGKKNRLFDSKRRRQDRQGRLLRVEELEDRRLLSVSAAEYAEICAAYADFGLSQTMYDVNIIEIDAANLTLVSLKTAIAEAGNTESDDLIVLRTTGAANTITYTDVTDAISINIQSEYYGTLSVVAFGSKPLTVDAAGKCSAMQINPYGMVNLGNLTITGGGIYDGAETLTLYNSIVAGNTAAYSNDILSCGSTINAYNVLSSYTGWKTFESCYFYDPSRPLFTDAANGDYTLCAGSQAINAGNNSYVLN